MMVHTFTPSIWEVKAGRSQAKKLQNETIIFRGKGKGNHISPKIINISIYIRMFSKLK